MPVPTLASPTLQVEGRNYKLTPLEDHNSYIAEAKVIAQKVHQAPPPAPPVRPDDVVSLAQYQTPIKDQGARGTCWCFAGAAAVEAAYKRKYGVTLDLSEQYIAHLGKVQELAYSPMDPNRSHENNSTLWDAQGASDILLKLEISAVCLETDAPYLSEAQMQAAQSALPGAGAVTVANANPSQAIMDAFEFQEKLVPSAARAKCKYLVTGVSSPSAWDAKTLQGILAGGTEVCVDIQTYYKTDNNGVWQYDPNAKNVGGHCVLLIGYDSTQQYFLVKNSWGGTAWYKMSFDFINHCATWAHCVTSVRDPGAGPDKRAFWMGTWNMDYDGWRGTLTFRRHVDYRNPTTPTRLGDFVRDGVTYDVNGHFDEGYQHCILYVAPSAARLAPGTETGLRFDLYCFSWDIEHAAGTNTNNGTYGAVLSRTPLPPERSNKFAVGNWVGSYTMNHDGWIGKLTITSVTPFAATYSDSSGNHGVSGSVNGHEARITIAFPGNNQGFDLFYHTWEAGVFAGTTVNGGQTYGVYGFTA